MLWSTAMRARARWAQPIANDSLTVLSGVYHLDRCWRLWLLQEGVHHMCVTLPFAAPATSLLSRTVTITTTYAQRLSLSACLPA